MLTIRASQVEVFSENRRQAFVERALDLLQQHRPIVYKRLGENEARRLIDDTIEDAKSRAIESETGVIACLELSLSYGDDFYEQETWAAYILGNDQLPEEEKVERLQAYVVEEQAEGSDEISGEDEAIENA